MVNIRYGVQKKLMMRPNVTLKPSETHYQVLKRDVGATNMTSTMVKIIKKTEQDGKQRRRKKMKKRLLDSKVKKLNKLKKKLKDSD